MAISSGPTVCFDVHCLLVHFNFQGSLVNCDTLLLVIDGFIFVVLAGLSLISKMESEDSGISEAEAKEFSSGEATQKEESEEEEDSDDLVSSKFNSFLASSNFMGESFQDFEADFP